MKILTALVMVTATLAGKTGLSDDWLNDMNDLVAEVRYNLETFYCKSNPLLKASRLQNLQKSTLMP